MYRKKIYESYISSTLEDNSQLINEFQIDYKIPNYIAKELPQNLNATFLDLGCGTGKLIKALIKNGFYKISGLEIGKEQLNILKKINANIIESNIKDFLILNKNRYDIIFLIDVLEHLNKNEVLEIIELLQNALENGGKIIIRVPNGEAALKGSIMYGDFTHETFYTGRSIKQIFKVYGYGKVNVYPCYEDIKGIKGLIKKFMLVYFLVVYKFLLSLDNNTSASEFIGTQNILAIVEK